MEKFRSQTHCHLALFCCVLLMGLVVASLPLGYSAIGGYDGPIFDVHEHAHQGSLGTENELLQMMDTNGISKMVLFDQGAGRNGDWASEISKGHKDRFNVFFTLFCYNNLACYTGTHIPVPEDSKLSERVWLALRSGLYSGIGEMNLRHSSGPCCPWGQTRVPLDHPHLLELYDLLAERDVPVIVHDELYQSEVNLPLVAELERALDHNNSTRIILAHAGNLFIRSPKTLDQLMLRHRNLYADLSWALVDPRALGRSLTGPSMNLLHSHADRFMIGFDFQSYNKEWSSGNAAKIIAAYRAALGQLDPVVAKKIAFQNMADILAHITPPQITVTSTIQATTTSLSSSAIMTSTVETTTGIATPPRYDLGADWSRIGIIAFSVALILTAYLAVTRRKTRHPHS